MTEPTASAARKPYDLATAAHDYPIWHGPPRRTILICTHPRSGSTLLGESLYFAGGLGCPLEYFHIGFRPTIAERWQEPALGGYGDAVIRHRTDPSGTLSIKIFWRDVMDMAIELDASRFLHLRESQPADTPAETYRELAALFAPFFPAPQFLYLSRRDRLRQALSSITANDTGLWRSIPNVGEQNPRGDPHFDLDRIEQVMGFADFCNGHWRNFFAALNITPYETSYEALSADYVDAATAVLHHLGSDAAPPPIRMRRQSNERNEATVLRYLRERAIAATVS